MKESQTDKSNDNGMVSESNEKLQGKVLVKPLKDNMKLFREIFSNDDTLILREFQSKSLQTLSCCVVYLDGMVDNKIISEDIIGPILQSSLALEGNNKDLLEELQRKVIQSNKAILVTEVSEIIKSVISGDTLLLLDGSEEALILYSKGFKTRNISEPESAKVVRGPREGFSESIIVNISLVRRKIKSPDLKFKYMNVGTRTETKLCISYIEGLAHESILEELERRIKNINIDGILDSGYIQEFIRDAPFSPFETVGHSERPDVIAGKVLEGRIAIFVDGSPFVLTVPYIMAEGYQASEDYYNNYLFSSFNRFLRASASLFSVSIPSIYLALVTYHQEMLPTPLLLSISSSKQGVPFPTVVSLFVMLLIFDVLREAAARMPTVISMAINIVGTLVLGQAIAEAKLVSTPVIIVTALTGILTMMNFTMTIAIISVRFWLLLFTSILGIYGYIFGLIAVVLHILSIRSFGVPYLMNLSSIKDHNAQDIWIRAPWWTMTLRPKIIGARNLVRQTSKKRR